MPTTSSIKGTCGSSLNIYTLRACPPRPLSEVLVALYLESLHSMHVGWYYWDICVPPGKAGLQLQYILPLG